MNTAFYLKSILLCTGLLVSLGSSAQLIKARFNNNDPSLPCSQKVMLIDTVSGDRIPLDTTFDDLGVTITLTEQEAKDSVVQHHLEEIAGVYEKLAKRLKKDRVVTVIDFSDQKFSWVYIYDVIRDCK